jgi:SpoVK/Ycf46/Vps4 family AAA+-type ATPase
VLRALPVPDPALDGLWDHLVLPDAARGGLLRFALFALRQRRALAASRTALHGLVVLTGPAGTGKTTAARGLAQQLGARLPSTVLVEVDPHALPSDLLGESQRRTAALFAKGIPEAIAGYEHAVVLVDEVESLAASRKLTSLETNPADLHRATDAVLTGVDRLAADHPHLLVVATTNLLGEVDEALVSRADLVVPFPLPDQDAAAAIVADTLDELAAAWPALRPLADDAALAAALAKELEGLDGRRIRKAIVAALAAREAVALDPAALTAEDLLATARRAAR